MDITIVIPTYNRKALLKHTLGSIIQSPISDARIIVVDNDSTDGTQAFLEDYCATHSTVTFAAEPERCAAAARNKGLSLVRTTWVYFFDSDDEFEDMPHEWDQSADMVFFPTRQKVENRTTTRAYTPVPDPALHIINGMLSTQSMVFKTSWLKEIGGWNTACKVWDDWELGARALMSNPKIEWITDKAYHTINVHSASLTGPDFKSRFKLQLEAIEQVYDSIRNAGGQDAARCRKALMLRTYILSGQLLYEGDKKASLKCRQFIQDHFGKDTGGKMAGLFLEQYTAMGLRGAWRIAAWNVGKNKNKAI